MGEAFLIFDLDGTLFQTDSVTVPAARQAFEHHGLTAPGAREICAFVGRTAAEYEAWLATLCPPLVAARIVAMAADRELDLIGRTGLLYPGVRDALAALRHRAARMAVCSNGSRRYVEAVLTSHGIDGLFDAVRFRRPEDRDKPQMVADLLTDLAWHPATPGIVIGDRRDDIEAARANGLHAIGCAYGFGSEDELADADAIAQRPSRLPPLVTELLQNRDSRLFNPARPPQ
jgi:phosphoglycolate phosphatase